MTIFTDVSTWSHHLYDNFESCMYSTALPWLNSALIVYLYTEDTQYIIQQHKNTYSARAFFNIPSRFMACEHTHNAPQDKYALYCFRVSYVQASSPAQWQPWSPHASSSAAPRSFSKFSLHRLLPVRVLKMAPSFCNLETREWDFKTVMEQNQNLVSSECEIANKRSCYGIKSECSA